MCIDFTDELPNCYLDQCSCVLFALQGILGTDSRRYALDLFRIFPPDPNYTPLEEEEEEEEGEGGEGREGEGKKGFRHKLAVFRPELLETFLQ